MPWAVAAAAVTAGAGIYSSNNAASASKSAANQVASAQQNTLDFQQGVYNNTTANLQPYVNTGTSALGALSSLYGLGGGSTTTVNGQPQSGALAAYNQYTQTPAYQFTLQQGQLGTNRSLAAQGLTGSGAQDKALTQYNQGYASSGFQNYIGQLASLAGLGENSSAQVGSQGNAAAQTIGAANTTSGNALGAGTVGAATAQNAGATQVAGALGGLLNNSGVQNYLTNLTGSSYGSTGQSTSSNSATTNTSSGT